LKIKSEVFTEKPNIGKQVILNSSNRNVEAPALFVYGKDMAIAEILLPLDDNTLYAVTKFSIKHKPIQQ
jgi:hypothetical protein